ncbi:MAG: glycosyltransferase [Firmicutes bacterium]|nr:glycosyltransferase [Candidatus Fermentithermobacillaceae bacterium]
MAGVRDLACKIGRELPFISILVPARNESDVIENTVRHLAKLKYPEDRYEIIVITDEKEKIAAKALRKKILSVGLSLLSGRKNRGEQPLSSEETRQLESLLLYVLASFAQNGDADGLYELCETLKDKKPFGRERRGGEDHTSLNAPVCSCDSNVALAREVLKAFYSLDWSTVAGTGNISHSPLASSDSGEKSFLARVRSIPRKELARVLDESLVQLFPTTQEVVEKVAASLGGVPAPRIKHVSVPYDFDGSLHGRLTGRVVKSTKGRALNWGLRFVDRRCEICGFYDAESRPHTDVLLFVAYRYLLDPQKSRILQGPVFQVRNFYKMSPFCRIASLYQAVAHDWYLPWLFKTLPFVGGTNLFVERKLLEEVGGWDHDILTEDLEFGTRAYLLKGAWPQYLPYHSSEQTPPNFRAFFRQRLRWATGHLQVVSKVADLRYVSEREQRELIFRLIMKGQFEWVVYQAATLVPPTALFLQFRHLLDETAVPPVVRLIVGGFSVVYLSFTFYAFLRYRPYFDSTLKPDGVMRNLLVVLGLFALPLAAFLFPIPYTWALILKSFGKEPRVWVKTPRTREKPA